MLIRTSNSLSENDLKHVLPPFLNSIPETLDVKQKCRPQDFTRTSNLPFHKVILSTISLVGKGNKNGATTHLGNLFRNARRSGLWPNSQAIHPSTLSKARKKVPWEVFRTTLHDAVVAYELWPDDPQYTWHGMSVYAIDGSKFTLPATEAMRTEFDPQSGLEYAGKGHYPQCLVSPRYDVFRRLPIDRTIVSIHGSERQEALALQPYVPPQSVLLFDRGYPSYELFHLLTTVYRQRFLCRCPATCTFPAVETFVNSGKAEATLWITPSNGAFTKLSPRQRKTLKAIKVRGILLQHSDGTVSVLITNLLNRHLSPCQDIIDLYFRRWAVEDYYKDEKVTLQIETFHSYPPNGIRQELFAAMMMTVIARTLMCVATNTYLTASQRCQFKHAILTLSQEAALLVPEDPERALGIFTELPQEIARGKYYPPAKPRPSQPRINKPPVNTWSKRNRQHAT
jgi:hypothetical protein